MVRKVEKPSPSVPLLGIILFTISGRGGLKAAGSEAQHAMQRAARARARVAAVRCSARSGATVIQTP
jgi:hypothetical protein